MSTDYVLYLSQETLMTAIYILTPILGSALMVGLAVGIFQAITSIQEMTLSFIPKIAIVGMVILMFMSKFLDIILVLKRSLSKIHKFLCYIVV